jgi:hypothetical protein
MTTDQLQELDNLFRKKILARDIYKMCPLCGNNFSAFRKPQVCHDIKRRYLATRWKMDNVIVGCSICNTEDVDISLIINKRFGSQTSENNRIFAYGNNKTYYHDVLKELT